MRYLRKHRMMLLVATLALSMAMSLVETQLSEDRSVTKDARDYVRAVSKY